ncbi:uncharacterized protein L969DRAFT_93478 [Mixia osmundae IAM 14324]|uniref:Exocyst complex component Sec3 PIP2-binding N-terminal domain-containing protein n=1 Tax=Mixia osmundae (strain CBS 9802 / IAM 14324 / JCM 22182 / KY 12970) TaxID=764103 RepID=G7DU33_MIXOS|nr:uncharacterized protein L969DRAFT_93478 [Mixia osmundae IAM 14324]KEI40960.1 hypothetical protein L969DRAFT_93478 [Mixia osmundae IAM 14324]GAA94093.1 hypothetical protein E5Q_00740 [Mixia osmundae IAM 14324]
MASPREIVRQQILASLYTTPDKGQLVHHLKTWEDVPGAAPGESKKPRYVLLTALPDRHTVVYKSKRNANGTFSIGKTWPIEDLTAIQVTEPSAFLITLHGKTYLWQTEQKQDQREFLTSLIQLHRQATGGTRPLQLSGIPQGDLNARSGGIATSIAPPTVRTPDGYPVRQDPRAARTPEGYNAPIEPMPRRESVASTGRSIPARTPPEGRRPSASRPTVSPSPRDKQPNERDDGRRRLDRSGSLASIHSNNAAQATRTASPAIPPTPSLPPHAREPVRREQAMPAKPRDAPTSPVLPSRSERRGQQPVSPHAPQAMLSPHARNAKLPALPAVNGNARSPSPRPISPQPPAQASGSDDPTLTNVEEMLEGFEWRSGGKGRGAADQIEAQLVGELQALEAASIHAIIESDDRVDFVLKHIDEALAELDKMDKVFSMHKTQLNAMSDDIEHIESHNKGLQVQTSNQRALLLELEQLLDTINVPADDLIALAQTSLESSEGIAKLEAAAVNLYKAILSTRDTTVGDMAAANEHVAQHRQSSSIFSKRIFDFLTVMFKFQADTTLNDKTRAITKANPKLLPHTQLEAYLGRYCGLMLFVKEIDDQRYSQICASYFTAVSELQRKEIADYANVMRAAIRKATQEEQEAIFTNPNSASAVRANTVKRPARPPPRLDGGLPGSEAIALALDEIGPHVHRESVFVSELLHIQSIDQYITFADYMDLEVFFRRGASAHLAANASRFKDIDSATDLIFGFLSGNIKELIDHALQLDSLQIFGIVAALDLGLLNAQQSQNGFLIRMLEKQSFRCYALLDKFIDEQKKAIELTKLTTKKRKGVAPFIFVFSSFVERVEAQLTVTSSPSVRAKVDEVYTLLVKAMFESLQQMAKLVVDVGNAEDKGQLNYHVVLIENMHQFTSNAQASNVTAMKPFLKQALGLYNENLSSYVRLVLRRPLAKLLDFFNGLESLLKVTPPSEVSVNPAHSKAALKRAVSTLSSKDLRKAIEALGKRVEKHFIEADSPQLMKAVWDACEIEITDLIGNWQRLIELCYANAGVTLDFSASDVKTAFTRTKLVG